MTSGFRRISRRHVVQSLAAGAALAGASPTRAQAAFPNKPITLICPWPAGGPTDLVMRAMAEVASKHLGQPVDGG